MDDFIGRAELKRLIGKNGTRVRELEAKLAEVEAENEQLKGAMREKGTLSQILDYFRAQKLNKKLAEVEAERDNKNLGEGMYFIKSGLKVKYGKDSNGNIYIQVIKKGGE